MAEAGRHGTPLTLLLLDVDNFKSVNDQYGHSYGDEGLQEVGAVLSRAVRTEDVAVRYDGEEFAVIEPRADAHGGEVLARCIANMLKAVCWKHCEITVSIGIAAHRAGLTSDCMLDRADQAMYRA